MLADPTGVLGRHGGAAAAHVLEGRGVVAAKLGRAHHLPGHGGHALKSADLLLLDESERFFGIPLVHTHQLASLAEAGQQLHVQPVHMKERHGQQHGRWLGRAVPDALGKALGSEGERALPAKQGVNDGAMGGEHALGA